MVVREGQIESYTSWGEIDIVIDSFPLIWELVWEPNDSTNRSNHVLDAKHQGGSHTLQDI